MTRRILRYVSEFPGAEGFSSVLGIVARGSALRSHRRAFELVEPAEMRSIDGVFRLH
jgi:hypothetical protein